MINEKTVIDETEITKANRKIKCREYVNLFHAGARWAESHLRETGQLLDWRPYPEEKPEGDGGDYFIAFRHAGPEKASVIATHGHKSNMWLEAKVYAWAYMPKPPQPDEL